MMKKYKLQFFLISLVVVFGSGYSYCLAETNGLPDMMVGQTTVTDAEGHTTYGGTTGNYSVLNSNEPYDFGFNRDTLINCMASNIIVQPLCFVLANGTSNAVRLLNSRTTLTIGLDRVVVLEVPALIYGNATVIGDTFGLDSNLFDYWGKNLAGSGGDLSDDSGATWKLKNYTLNPNAQMAWDGTNNNPQFAQFNDKLQNLAASAVSITSGVLDTTPIWNLCGETIVDAYNAETSCDAYPEGKVWSVNGNLDLATSVAKTIKFQGVGTIIVNGNINIQPKISILPIDNMTDKVGFIATDKTVDHDCTYGGSGDINAMLFCKGKMIVKDNSDMTGSFVAKSFAIGTNIASPVNVNFFFDYNIDTHIPPGFRTLIVPTSNEVGNKP